MVSFIFRDVQGKNFILKNFNSKSIRNQLFLETNKDYKYLTYEKSKEIIHNEINMIDIYGNDNMNPKIRKQSKDSNQCIDKNLEHIFPQSFFKNNQNKKFMKSDLHNLYLCNSKLNTYRQNFKYIDTSELDDNMITKNDKILDSDGNLIDFSDKSNLMKKNGFLMITNKKNKTFIPTEYSRGKVARSISYFTIKYNLIDDLNKIINPLTLIKWNYYDPVDNYENLKNIISYRYQKNLNPFIINSDLVYYCFSDLCQDKNSLKEIQNIFDNKIEKSIDHMLPIEYLLSELEKYK